jgi:two-component system cell cycle sensor histidine kinase/response regulator CckA
MVVFLVDPDTGKIVEANTAACSYYGYSKGQLTRLKITDINTLPDEELKKRVDEVMSKTQGRFFFTHRLANGEIRNVESFVGPIVVNGKHLLYSMVHDITERVQAEKAFWGSQERYRLLIESMNDGFVILDENDLFSFVNDKFLDMLGCAGDEVLGNHTLRFLDEKSK